ncbi:hypothetical protein BDZ97DRAFT_1827584 [Flammula alnicola]|nr:hypothetical protein BDZ97DRAFT_1827584 [Flammula alnicola]
MLPIRSSKVLCTFSTCKIYRHKKSPQKIPETMVSIGRYESTVQGQRRAAIKLCKYVSKEYIGQT